MRLPAMLADRHRWPGWVNALVDRVIDSPPEFLWKRMSPLARAAAPEEIPELPVPAPDAEIRLVVGPANFAGQGERWARALAQSRGGVWAHTISVEGPDGFRFASGTTVAPHVHASSADWQERVLGLLSRSTHVLIEAERPLLGRRHRSFEEEARELIARGLDLACIAHGTDVRIPSVHAEIEPWSPYRASGQYLGRLETVARRNVAALARLGRPVFVSTPDLRDFVPGAFWCPVVVQPDRWAAARGAHRERPVVSHAPSHAALKGTDLVIPAMRRLESEGLIEFRLIERVPATRMPEVYAESDIVLDQFRLGSYGAAACEAMASGAAVVGHVSRSVRETVQRETGLELPVVEADGDSLADVIRGLVADPARLEALAERGRAFVGEVHDGRWSARALEQHWLDA